MKAFIFAAVFSMSTAFALATKDKLPELSTKMTNVDGKEITLADISKGKKATLVIFTCNACPFAKAWWDRMEKIGNDYSKKNVGVVAINSNDPKEVPDDDFEHMKTRAKGLQYPYVVDATSHVAKSFGASKTPEVFLFNSKQELVYQGAIDSDAHNAASAKPYLKDSLDSVLAGKSVPVAENKALGCGIKFRATPGK